MNAFLLVAMAVALFTGAAIGLTVGCLLAAGKGEDVAAGREEM